MKTVLINTLSHFLGPPQGPARLYAYARRNGLPVELLDLNHDIFFHLLSSQSLRELWLERRSLLLGSQAIDRFSRADAGGILLASSAGEVAHLLADILRGADSATTEASRNGRRRRRLEPSLRRALHPRRLPFLLDDHLDEVSERIGAASRQLDERFLRLGAEAFLAAFRLLLCGKAILDLLHYPAMLDFGLGFQGSKWEMKTASVLAACRDRRHNWLLPYFRSRALPRILGSGAQLIGISVTHYSELIPAMTLATLLRDALPDVHLVLGGALIAYLRVGLANNPGFWEVVDSAVWGPGEIPLLELAEALAAGRPLAGVPGLLYRTPTGVRSAERTVPVDLDTVPTAEYTDLRPGAILGLETSTTCSWGRCAFCSYSCDGSTPAPPTRPRRSLERVVEDLATLSRRYDPALVSLTDHTVPADRLLEIARWNRGAATRVPFSAFVRLERPLLSPQLCEDLAAGGLLGCQSGLESGSQRVNDRMGKGTDLSIVPRILGNLRRAGILVHLYTIVGFPGETEAEAWSTFDFIERHRSELGLDWQIYWLTVLEGTRLATEPERYGLTPFRPSARQLVPYCSYRVREGLSSTEARRLALLMDHRLSPRRHRYARFMDPELVRLFLLSCHAERTTARR